MSGTHNAEHNRAYVRHHGQAKRDRIAAIKLARGCVDCGYNAHSEALEFDHRPGVDKVSRVSAMSTSSWARIEAEIAKCDIRCANCHAVITRARTNGSPS